MLSRPTSSNRQPSRDGLPSPPRSDAGTNQDGPARSPVPASLFPRHYPCQQRLISPVGANVLGRFSMAGFELITYGRFWVIAEEKNHATSIKVSSLWRKQLIFGTARGVPRYHADSAICTYPINTKPTGLSGGGFSMPL